MTAPRWLESASFALLARLCSVFGTALAGAAVWIFLVAWGDIRAIGDKLAEMKGTERVHESRLAEHDRRLLFVERVVLPWNSTPATRREGP